MLHGNDKDRGVLDTIEDNVGEAFERRRADVTNYHTVAAWEIAHTLDDVVKCLNEFVAEADSLCLVVGMRRGDIVSASGR